jgi:hypothetical protein
MFKVRCLDNITWSQTMLTSLEQDFSLPIHEWHPTVFHFSCSAMYNYTNKLLTSLYVHKDDMKHFFSGHLCHTSDVNTASFASLFVTSPSIIAYRNYIYLQVKPLSVSSADSIAIQIAGSSRQTNCIHYIIMIICLPQNLECNTTYLRHQNNNKNYYISLK